MRAFISHHYRGYLLHADYFFDIISRESLPAIFYLLRAEHRAA